MLCHKKGTRHSQLGMEGAVSKNPVYSNDWNKIIKFTAKLYSNIKRKKIAIIAFLGPTKDPIQIKISLTSRSMGILVCLGVDEG